MKRWRTLLRPRWRPTSSSSPTTSAKPPSIASAASSRPDGLRRSLSMISAAHPTPVRRANTPGCEPTEPSAPHRCVLLEGDVFQTGLLVAARARPLDHIDRKVSLAQLGDEVSGDDLPRAGFRAPDPVMVRTIFHTGNRVFVDHHCTSGLYGGSGPGIRASRRARHQQEGIALGPDLPRYLLCSYRYIDKY